MKTPLVFSTFCFDIIIFNLENFHKIKYWISEKYFFLFFMFKEAK